MRHHQLVAFVLVASLSAAACSRSRHYELKGQVLSVDPAHNEITIKHEDIKGFMPGMTMPFKVQDSSALVGFTRGDFVTATLIVGPNDAHLSALAKTGHQDLSPAQAAETPVRVLEPGETVPDVALVDDTGAARRLSDWKGRTRVITFVYTRCPLPEFCPRMDRNFADVQRAVKADATLRDRVHLLSLSFDTDYDTPAVLHEHATRVGAQSDTWTYATGTRADIEEFGQKLGMSIIREDPQNVEIVHNLRTAVVRPDGTLATIFNGNEWTPSDLLAAIKNASDVRR